MYHTVNISNFAMKVDSNIFFVVKLTKEFSGLPIGTEGTIVHDYDGTMFEVEFFDDKGDTIDVFMTPKDHLMLVSKT